MRRFDLLYLLLWLCMTDFLPQLAKAAFYPESSLARFAGVGSESGGKHGFPSLPEHEGQLWQPGSIPPYYQPYDNSAAVTENFSTWEDPPSSWGGGLWEDIESRPPKQARLESFIIPTQDQAYWVDNASRIVESSWDLRALDPMALYQHQQQAVDETPTGCCQQPVVVASTHAAQEDQVNDQFEEMLSQDRPAILPTPLAQMESPRVPFQATLNKHRLPEYTQLAIRYVNKFQPALRRVFECQLDQEFWTGPAMMGAKFPESGMIIRARDPSDSTALVVPFGPSQKLHDIQSLSIALTELHIWIIHVHSVLWRRIVDARSVQADRQKLILWLFGEIFNPKQGLPVVGKVYLKNPLERTFGIVQTWLIKYLLGRESVPTTSSAIVAIWSKNTQPEQWREKITFDHYFWARATILLKKDAVTLPPTINPENGNHMVLKRKRINKDIPRKLQIGDFALIDMRYPAQYSSNTATLTWLTAPFLWELPKTVDELRKPIMEKFSRIAGKELGGTRQIHKIFPKEGVALTRHKSDSIDQLRVRLWSAEKEDLTRLYSAGDKLKKLLISVEICSSSILSHLVNTSKEPIAAPPSQTAHFDWLARKLFDVEVLFPIFGKVQRSVVDSASEDTPHFDEVQIFLLKIFIDNKGLFKYLEAALALLGYWLKNENPSFWNQHLKSDEFYSKMIMSAMDKKFVR
ncbi:hypothetical protein PGT21_014114 [Puccinia graminis f. sp. tritici]|uniref:Uncharacterized protein n=2 Tax=Puccinia graminis f. sp. tritici TaxID=56615 RepID=E3KJ63_PUCGT|nr:uncharacterized protein PGTG_10058 [Puccinia graminis f. sp. tritici CRL 75-36-700-3]EFP84338.2 hypothetical protein PGTG_10058 [Puccinia graminis f. sp. tritici CRL 75-36-700-3]KAA1089328.1 hypothetical protein PGT21_014114 [Puccinia graminis f. sp. tritici]KAA1091836.1 hypothetical protein PGTUg99_006917 [Puccinia graminis f. sp. tritici]